MELIIPSRSNSRSRSNSFDYEFYDNFDDKEFYKYLLNIIKEGYLKKKYSTNPYRSRKIIRVGGVQKFAPPHHNRYTSKKRLKKYNSYDGFNKKHHYVKRKTLRHHKKMFF